ncbi:MAG: helix-turn-helix transcriptional regulator [Bacteroidales bacterium]
MKERILAFLKAENKSSSQFAEEIGVQASGISHIISGRNKPSLDFILKMLEKYPYLSTEWLLFGRGEMFSEQSMQDLFTEANETRGDALSDEQEQPHKTTVKNAQIPSEVPSTIKRNIDLEKIVCFNKNGTFREYFPSDD